MPVLSETLLDESEERAARMVALELLATARREFERFRAASDPEALHDFRVSIRRLRSWLRAQRSSLEDSVPKRAVRALEAVAQATNASRDAEVFQGWLATHQQALPARARVGANWLSARVADNLSRASEGDPVDLSEEFSRAREALEARLPYFRLTHHIARGPIGVTFAVGMAALVRQQAGALDRRLGRVHDASAAAPVHRARIAGKRLRYILEPIAGHVPGGPELITRLKGLQDSLGDLHDAHVWMEHVREGLEASIVEEGRQVATVARVDGGGGSDDEGATPRRPDPRPGLIAITQLVRERAKDAFDRFAKDWSGPAAAPFFERVDAFAATLERRQPTATEIERKYLLYALPENWPEGEVQFIEQGYVPGDRLIERLRRVRTRSGERWFRTVKSGEGIIRVEIEEETTREIYDAMWPLTAGRRVSKRRYCVRDGTLVWEIDEFTDRSLVLAEVELTDADAKPELPEWLAPFVVREVTNEAEYVNANLAR
jgi:CHAD domain-containing protein/CYTH domain-containing protein